MSSSRNRSAASGSRRLKCLMLATAGSIAALAAVPASAQEARANTLQEVVVTARKRQESILNVPVITNVVGGAELQRLQITNVRGITSVVPGLVVGDSVLANGVQFSLRGVGTTALDPGIDQSVSLNIDGLQLTQGLAFYSALFDVGQVEVYKGPQSLFYGKSSPGGVIAIRTADPTNTPEIIIRAGYEFEARDWQQDFILSGPLTDTLKARIAVRHTESEGFYYNRAHAFPNTGAVTSADSRIGGTTRWLGRGTVLWNPTSNFDARVKWNYASDLVKWAGTGQFVGCPEGIRVLNPALPFLDPSDNCRLDRDAYVVGMDPAAFPGIPHGGVPTLDQTQRYGTLELNYRPTEAITLTSDTGYYSIRSETLLNSSQTSLAGPPTATQNDYHRRDYTQELRANSDFSGPLNFTAGAFFQDAEINQQVTQRGNQRGPFAAQGVIRSTSSFNLLQIRSKSYFGQLRYKLLPPLELAAGARWTSERRSFTAHRFPQFGGGYVPVATPARDTDNWSPEFTATYRPTDDVTLFASWKKGYKSGSYNLSTLPVPGAENSYADESVKGYEGGVKARLFERRMTVNLAAYGYDYDNLQVGAVLPAAPGTIPITQTLNAAKAKISGVDLDAAYLAMEGLTLRGALNWNHARYSKFDNATCWTGQTLALGCNLQRNPVTGQGFAQDLSHTPLVRAPDWEGNFGFTYEMPVGQGGLRLIFDNNNQFSSKYVTTLARRSDIVQGGYIKADLSFTLQGPKDEWEVSLAARNLNNKYTFSNCSLSNYEGSPFQVIPSLTGLPTNGPAGQAEASCFADPGRSVTLTFTWRPLAGR
jgi:iron complex outermembrane receptor protein